MENLGTFLANNYLWFLIAGVVLILALIGYIVDSKNIKPVKLATMKVDNKDDAAVEEVKAHLKEKGNMSLKDATNKINTINTSDQVETLNDVKLDEPVIKEETKSESTFNSEN
jgi:p-aminobenzoyl-glutamate transporter AbgT